MHRRSSILSRLSVPYAVSFRTSNQLSHRDCWWKELKIMYIIYCVSFSDKTVVYTIATMFFTLVFRLSFSLSQHCCDIRKFNLNWINVATKLLQIFLQFASQEHKFLFLYLGTYFCVCYCLYLLTML